MTKKHPSNTLIRLLLLSNVHACTCTCACSASNWCHRRKSHRLEWLAAEHAKPPDVARTRLLTVDTGATETAERARAASVLEKARAASPDSFASPVRYWHERGKFNAWTPDTITRGYRSERIELYRRGEGARRGGAISNSSPRVLAPYAPRVSTRVAG